jgi:hypothetical protein
MAEKLNINSNFDKSDINKGFGGENQYQTPNKKKLYEVDKSQLEYDDLEPKELPKENELLNTNNSEDSNNSSTILGYLNGYNVKTNPNYDNTQIKSESNNPKIEDENKLTTDKEVINLTSMPTDSEYGFKYKNIDDFEDPTYLTFDIIMYTDTRPLWDDTVGYGAYAFLNRNKNTSDTFNVRLNYLKEFRNKLRELVYTSEDVNGLLKIKNKKTYYIESIKGMNNLKKPIVSDEDNLTVTLNEDVKMTAEYITELYNNLSYDYRYKRHAIPENCLRFDMAIVVSDVRKFKVTPSKGNKTQSSESNKQNNSNTWNSITNNPSPETRYGKNAVEQTINPYVSRQIYILRDCNFDFSESYNFEDGVSQAGDNLSYNVAKSNFKIKYKSVERTMFADLFYLTKKGNRLELATHELKPVDSYYKDRHNDYVFNKANVKYLTSDYNGNIIEGKNNSNLNNQNRDFFDDNIESLNLSEKTKRTKNVGFGNINNDELDVNPGFLSSAANSLIDEVSNAKNQLISQYKTKALNWTYSTVNEFLEEETSYFDFDWLVPENVYSEDFNNPSIQSFAKNLGGKLINTLQSEIQGEALDYLNAGESGLNSLIDRGESGLRNLL